MTWYHSLTLAQSDAAPPPPATDSAAPAPTNSEAPATTTGADGVPATGDDAAAAPQPSPWGFLMPMVILLAVFWLLILMPQRREKKKRAELLASLKKGDKVQTIGGILGTVIEVREHEIIVKVDESANSRLRFARGAVQTVLPDGKPQETN
ncbi:preprotein translocase subunit YajC [Planctomycetales bacterium ZRK34]|nr:preprotein translocase subunit YajC [Planctomycetales bacterium ZRK34]